MTNKPSNDDRRLEQMVAYLDGELTPVEVSLVERQLAEDVDFRQDLQSIERAWSALDALPITTVDDKFSQTTMEMVVGAARQELVEKTHALPIRRRKNYLSKILLATAGAALALLMVRLVRENPNRVLLADLPSIQYVDIYSQFEDVDFLRKLHAELGDDVWVADLAATDLDEQISDFKTIAVSESLRDWVEQLDDEDRAALRARFNRFLALSPEEQTRLRELHTALTSAPDHDQLERTMLQYQVWLNALPASRQFELNEKPVDERVREIVTQQRREANNQWIELSPEEYRRLDQALESIRRQIFQELAAEQRENFSRPNNRERGRPTPFERQQVVRQQFIKHRDEWVPQILAALSANSKTAFERLPRQQQQRQMMQWILQTRDRREGQRGEYLRFDQVSQQDLERFFAEETDAATKERLLALPRDKMEQQLKRLYFRGAPFSEMQPEGEFPREESPFGPPRGGGERGFRPPRGFGGPEG
ncbi:MAG: hypothetical protein SH868_16295, partial [Bythopirellula sp.]|nr:hypothetical protein [Bythopirellula sp.]